MFNNLSIEEVNNVNGGNGQPTYDRDGGGTTSYERVCTSNMKVTNGAAIEVEVCRIVKVRP